MTPDEQLFAQYWAEFVQTFPFMNDHIAWVPFPPDQEPEMGLDPIAFFGFVIWCWHQGYGNREELREILRLLEQRTRCSLLERDVDLCNLIRYAWG
jgi:hypothetical protein